MCTEEIFHQWNQSSQSSSVVSSARAIPTLQPTPPQILNPYNRSYNRSTERSTELTPKSHAEVLFIRGHLHPALPFRPANRAQMYLIIFHLAQELCPSSFFRPLQSWPWQSAAESYPACNCHCGCTGWDGNLTRKDAPHLSLIHI